MMKKLLIFFLVVPLSLSTMENTQLCRRTISCREIPPLAIVDQSIDQKEPICAICWDELASRKTVELSCHETHQFHTKCLAAWREVSDVCPLCIRPVRIKPVPEEAFNPFSFLKTKYSYAVLAAALATVGSCMKSWSSTALAHVIQSCPLPYLHIISPPFSTVSDFYLNSSTANIFGYLPQEVLHGCGICVQNCVAIALLEGTDS